MSHMPIGTSGCGVGGSSGSGAIVGGIANGDPPQVASSLAFRPVGLQGLGALILSPAIGRMCVCVCVWRESDTLP